MQLCVNLSMRILVDLSVLNTISVVLPCWLLMMLKGFALCVRLNWRWRTFDEHLNHLKRPERHESTVAFCPSWFFYHFSVGSLGCWIPTEIKYRKGNIWNEINFGREKKPKHFQLDFFHRGANHFHFHLYVCVCVCIFPFSQFIHLTSFSVICVGYCCVHSYNIQHSKLGQLVVYSFVCRFHTILSNSLSLMHMYVEGVHLSSVYRYLSISLKH